MNTATIPIQSWKEEIALQDCDYHLRQFDSPYRSTFHLIDFMQQNVPVRTGNALDVGCGAGSSIYHFSQSFGNFQWSGIDAAGRVLFPLSKKYFGSRAMNPDLHHGNFDELIDLYGPKSFDLVVSVQTLLTLPSYETALDQLLAVTKGWLVMSSLFTDFNVDVKCEVFDYTWPGKIAGPHFYNTYSLRRFCQYCEERGARNFIVKDFDIDIDLPVQPERGFHTHTRILSDGKRLQFTGPVFQSWKFLAMEMR